VGVGNKPWDPLIETLEIGIRVGNQFPATYNQALLTGWFAYAQRALRKMEAGDAVLLEHAKQLYRQGSKVLAIYLEEPTLLKSANLSHFEHLAEVLESRIVQLGLLPPLIMLRLDDMDTPK
jgi:hypothetical protein